MTDPDTLQSLGPWGGPAVAAVWVLKEVVVPAWKKWRYSNGADRRSAKKEPSHADIITKIEDVAKGLWTKISEVSERLAKVEGKLEK